METSPLICRANQCTGFCMIGTTVMKELKPSSFSVLVLTEGVAEVFCQKDFLKNFCKIHRKAPVSESLFVTFPGFRPAVL